MLRNIYRAQQSANIARTGFNEAAASMLRNMCNWFISATHPGPPLQ